MIEFSEQLSEIASRILKSLSHSEASPTAWELKLQVKAPLSQLYMALGLLIQRDRVRVSPEGLSYRVHLVKLEKSQCDPTLAAKTMLGVEDVLGANAVPEETASKG